MGQTHHGMFTDHDLSIWAAHSRLQAWYGSFGHPGTVVRCYCDTLHIVFYTYSMALRYDTKYIIYDIQHFPRCCVQMIDALPHKKDVTMPPASSLS
jgi:hypothetical protein